MDQIIEEFYNEMKDIKLEAYGILDSSNKIHTLGTDSKIIGRVFEMFTQPVLEKISHKLGLQLATPDSQTVYPDFIMMESASSKSKIAIDVKTTYIESTQPNIKFTLGSYASYMRNNTKNIEYKYTDYTKHYVIGFVYKRNGQAQESQVVDYADRTTIQFPFCEVKYFIQEKYKIAGDKPGSGNTENIGSISSKRFEDFSEGKGPFSILGEDVFNIYWKYYPQYRNRDAGPYTSLKEFITWLPNQTETQIELLHKYDFQQVKETVLAYASRYNAL